MLPFKVLILGEEGQDRARLAEGLVTEGFSVSESDDGLMAPVTLLANKVDLVLLDYDIPRSSALEICRSIKDDPDLRDTLVFVYAAETDLEKKVACFSAGADEVVGRDFETSELVIRIWRNIQVMLKTRSGGASEDLGVSALLPIIRPSQEKYGAYRVESVAGSDATGTVYRAFDEVLKRTVAVEILSKRISRNREFMARYEIKIRRLISLSHPGIPDIYYFGEQNGEFYMAREWLPQGSLAMLIRSGGRLEPKRCLSMIKQAAEALAAAAKIGIIHGALRPNYVLLNEEGNPKISGLGLVSVDTASIADHTRIPTLIQASSFLAPELADPANLDLRSDIYSLGMIFYYVLYGVEPFASSLSSFLAGYRLPSFDDLGGTIPEEFYTVIQKMTQVKREDRHANYDELIKDLMNCASALPPTSVEAALKVPVETDVVSAPLFAGENLFDALACAYREDASGVLSVHWLGLRKKFLVHRREVVLFESTQPDEDIWFQIERMNLIHPHQAPAPGELMEAVLNRLVPSGELQMEQFAQTYKHVMQESLMQVFHWQQCSAEFHAAKIVNDPFAGIAISDVLAEAARNVLDSTLINSCVKAQVAIARTPRFEELFSNLHLTAEESFLAFRIEGDGLTVGALRMIAGHSEDVVNRLLYLLERTGTIAFHAVEQRQAKPGAQPPSAAVPQASNPVPPSTAPPRSAFGITQDGQVRMEVAKSEKLLEAEIRLKAAEQYYEKAFKELKAGNPGKAMMITKQAIQCRQDAKYYLLLARSCSATSRFRKEAEEAYHHAIQLAPYDSDLHVELAQFYFEVGLLIRSRTHVEEAMALAPKDPGVVRLNRLLAEKHVGNGNCWCTGRRSTAGEND